MEISKISFREQGNITNYFQEKKEHGPPWEGLINKLVLNSTIGPLPVYCLLTVY